MNDKTLFTIRNLRFSYPGTGVQTNGENVLEIESLSLEEGKISVLCGPNGSGKTTLLKLLNGLLKPTGGVLLYRERPLDAAGLLELRSESVLVHQNPYLFDGTVFQNVSFGLWVRRFDRKRMRDRVTEKLALLGLKGFEKRKVHRLSGGERQRVAIARALALEPGVLMLDEPTANVDPRTIALIEDLLGLLCARGTTVILSSHNLSFAYRVGNILVTLVEGRTAAGSENIVRGTTEGADDRFTYFRTGGHVLKCPAQKGSFSTAVLSVDDVILSREPVQISAQNQFHGTVTAVKRQGHILRVCLDCGFQVEALVTEDMVDAMKIAEGESFSVIFKASAIRLY
ncbi:MAG TPA: ATP-binding cassette domain-containing protein [Spirochaetia bacterium]|nr:ATP-binding cassette domain-containing protein [Spirochaetia bacterium]